MYPDANALDQAANLIAAAHYPVLLLGRQCQGSAEAGWLRALAENVPAPVLTTDQAKGVLPDSHPLAFGALGSGVERALLSRADLVVAIGLDPAERVPRLWPAGTRVALLVEEELPELECSAAAVVRGEICQIVEELAPRLRGKTQANWDVSLLDRLKREQRSRP